MEQAAIVDEAIRSLPHQCCEEGHDALTCFDCSSVNILIQGLTARLTACGVTFPAGILDLEGLVPSRMSQDSEC